MADEPTWRCPVYGSPLTGERLEVEEDTGGVTAVYVLNYPNRDFHATLTERGLVRVASELVFERINRS